MKRLLVSLALLATGAACGGGGGGNGNPAPGDPFGLLQRVLLRNVNIPTGLASPSQLQAVVAFPNLLFSRPLFLTHAGDGTNRLFVVEQDGRIRVFANDANAGAAAVFLDIVGRVSRAGNEEGLLGLAFHPDYENNGFFYVYYSLANPRRSRLSRFTVTANPSVADPNSEMILLEFSEPFSNHNGGCLAFGPDGKLYVASGDGGSGGDPQNNGQNLGTLLGKILRLNDDGTIPADNPFVGQAGARGEIWAFGLRNPWRFSFDRNNGNLWCADVGQGAIEEVDLITRGGNYGWRVFEGNNSFNNPQGLPAANFIGPVVTYTHALGQSITGGYVYRGARLTTLIGAYLYADFVTGRVFATVHDGNQVISNEEVGNVPNPASFGEDQAGEVYVCSFDGRIYRFDETTPGGGDFPQTLSATGLFTNLANLTPTAGLQEYDVNAPLWSDGAQKRRWIGVPGQARITFTPTGAWVFPLGTVLVKHFEIALAAGGVRRLETRVLINTDTGWQGYTYKWNGAQSDADLLADSETETITIAGAQGPEQLDWFFPSRVDCMTCHTAAAGRILGTRTRQLNRDFDYPNATDNQLRSLNNIGLFATDIGDHTQYEAMPNPLDQGAPIAQRARAYLHANCALCHLPAGPTSVNIDFRFGIPIAQTNLVGVAPTTGLGVPNTFRITALDRTTSQVFDLIGALDNRRMPPLASHRIDAEGREVIGTWIDAGAGD